MTEDAVDRASQAYDVAEKAYIEALASGAEEALLRSLARVVADAARSWEAMDNAIAPPNGIDRYYDVPEVVSSLWRDLADAHDQRAR
jgi:hypothetical protein